MQEQLFDMPLETPRKKEPWEEEWKGMPEFIQDRLANPYATVIIRFATKEDLDDFSKLIGQKLTQKSQSIWHPILSRGLFSKMRYVDES